MARNEEKHFCNLNRLILLKEKEDYEKVNPPRPRLDTLYSPEEIQKWLPSIKKDIDFYLKKSQVTCYSDAHVEECKEKVIKLEKEFKAFVWKIKQLTSSPLDAIPWTNRPYKRKKSSNSEQTSYKEFKRISTPILDTERKNSPSILNENTLQCVGMNWNLMDQPLSFSSMSANHEKPVENTNINLNVNISSHNTRDSSSDISNDHHSIETKKVKIGRHSSSKIEKNFNQTQLDYKIVNYDSSDCDSS